MGGSCYYQYLKQIVLYVGRRVPNKQTNKQTNDETFETRLFKGIGEELVSGSVSKHQASSFGRHGESHCFLDFSESNTFYGYGS